MISGLLRGSCGGILRFGRVTRSVRLAVCRRILSGFALGSSSVRFIRWFISRWTSALAFLVDRVLRSWTLEFYLNRHVVLVYLVVFAVGLKTGSNDLHA